MKKNSILNYIKTIFHSCQVELILFFKDSALYVSFAILSIVVAYVYSAVYQNEVVNDVPMAVVDHDNSTLSRELVRMMDATQEVSIYGRLADMGMAKKEFYDGDVYGILYIPEGFEKDLSQGKQTAVSLYSDASNMLHNKSISTAIANVVGTFNAQVEVNNLMNKGLGYTNSLRTRRPINAITRNVFNPYGGYATFLLPVVYLVIIQTLLLSAIGVLGGTMREQKKYFSRFHIVDAGIGKIIPVLLGRSLAYLMLCVMVFSIMCGCVGVFKLPFRANYLDVLLFLVPFFLAVIFLGFTLMGIFKRREDGALSVTFISIPSVFLTGISWPAMVFPLWVNVLSYVFPTTIGSRGFVAMTQYGASLVEIKNLWGQMWLTACFYFLLAIMVNYKLKLVYTNKKPVFQR